MNDQNLRIIATARSEKAINDAVLQGFWPLVKPVIPSPEIKSKYAVLQDKVTGKVSVIHDFRAKGYSILGDDEQSPTKTVINFTSYYPHHFESPFAAYLIPKDLEVNETVFIEDLIEDIVGGRWNQGDTYRLENCMAVWDGKDFIISHNPSQNVFEMIG
ncbi:MAG: hypothetical protein JWR05_3375 [Mucilaginibacter sp.]|nr:hypothetical protein [Mucilaginibacter sp.]